MGASFCSSSSGTSGAASSIWLAMLKVSESDALDGWPADPPSIGSGISNPIAGGGMPGVAGSG